MQTSVRLNLLLLLSICVVTGCHYDRSFLQMDSNSGSPFLGLQWSVDSGTRPADAEAQRTLWAVPEPPYLSGHEYAVQVPVGHASTWTVSSRPAASSASETASFQRRGQDNSRATAISLRLTEF